MDIVFHTGDVPNALLLMLLGMVGIFAVILVIWALVALLNRITAPKRKQEDNA